MLQISIICFGGCTSLTSIDLSNFNTNKITDISELFSNCGSLRYIDLSGTFKINDGTNYNTMFYGANFNKLRIKSSQDTANKLKSKYSSFTDNNFEIVE